MARIAHFDLGEELARSSSGRLVRARDTREGADAILRLLPLAGFDEIQAAEMKLRFRREIEIARTVQHPSIFGVRDTGVADKTLWLAAAPPAGVPLSEFTTPGHRLEPRRLIRLVLSLAEMLEHAQSKGLVRCDIEPETIFLADGVTLVDFGLARVADPARKSASLGSAQFLAPERVRDGAPGPASNQFALAVLTYHLLSGAWPFSGRDIDDVQEMLHAEPEPLSAHRPELPGAIGRVLARGLHREPANRYPGTRAFAEAFGAAFDEETILPPKEPSFESGIWPADRLPEKTRVSPPAPSHSAARLAPRIRRKLTLPTPRQGMLAVGAVLLLGGLAWGATRIPWTREERITRMAERGEYTAAADALRKWKASDPGSADLAITEGNVAFARKDYPTSAAAYLRGLTAEPDLVEDPRVVDHVMASMVSNTARPSLVDLAPLLPEEVEPELWKRVLSSTYAIRWNAARMLEARGRGAQVDWTGLYITDLRTADSCNARKRAAQHLGMTHEVRALTAIQAAQDDTKVKSCKLKKVLENAEAALLAP